jgi:hypothetical protein
MTAPILLRASALDRWLARYTLAAAARSGLVLAIAAVAFALAVAAASRLRVQGDFVELLPRGSVHAERFREALARKGGGESTLVVLIESQDPARNREFVDALARELPSLPPSLGLSLDFGPREARAYFQRFRWFFPSLAELERIECELDRERQKLSPLDLGLDEPCQSSPSPAAGAAPPEAAAGKDRDRLAELERELEARIQAEDRYPEGYYRTPDGHVYSVVVRAPRAGMGEEASDRVLAEVSARVERVVERVPGPRISYGGDIPTAIAERDALLDDIGVVSLAATLLVFCSIVIFFRSLKALICVGACATLGTAMAFAMASLAFGRLNAATSFLGSVVIGNGINYSIMYLARYLEKRREGAALEAALVDAAISCRRGTWLAALAASLAYLALTATSFRGFSEFGWIGGVGMVSCWASTFGLLPACVARFDTRETYPPRREGERWPGIAVILTGIGARAPRVVIGVSTLLFVVSAAVALRFLADPWEYDFSKLRSESSSKSGASRSSSLADKVFVSRGSPVLFLADSLEQAPRLAERVLEADRRRGGQPLIEKVETLYDRLGGEPAEQAKKLELLSRIREHAEVLSKRAKGRAAEIIHELRPPEDLRAPRVADLPSAVLKQFQESNGRVGTPVFVSLNPKLSQSRGQNLLQFADLFEEVRLSNGEPAPNAGRAVIFADMIRSMERDGPRATVLAFLAVVLVSALVTRSLRAMVSVVGAMLLSVAVTVAFSAATGLRLNFLNFVALPLTFGIGVEYAINIFDRARFESDPRRAGQSVAGAVALSSLTTVLGYGSLLFADNLALRSFGRLAIAGEIASLAAALVVVPAALALRQRRATPPIPAGSAMSA